MIKLKDMTPEAKKKLTIKCMEAANKEMRETIAKAELINFFGKLFEDYAEHVTGGEPISSSKPNMAFSQPHVLKVAIIRCLDGQSWCFNVVPLIDSPRGKNIRRQGDEEAPRSKVEADSPISD